MNNSTYEDQVLMDAPDYANIEEAIPLIIFNEQARGKLRHSFSSFLMIILFNSVRIERGWKAVPYEFERTDRHSSSGGHVSNRQKLLAQQDALGPERRLRCGAYD